MRRVKRTGGRAEMAVRREVFRLGGRYRVDDGSVTGRPDLCFRRAKVAVFIDSVFWHGQIPPARIARMSPFWQEKLRRNRRRDAEVNRLLSRHGWLVIRVREQVARAHAAEVAVFILAAVRDQEHRGRVVRLHEAEQIAITGSVADNS